MGEINFVKRILRRYKIYKKPAKTSVYTSVVQSSFLPAMGIFPKLYILLAIAVMITYLTRREKQS